LQRGEPFVENAEALGLFLEYEEEKNVLLLGCGTSPDKDDDERENRHYQNDKNDSNDIENEHSCFDLETFVKDVAERLHVDDDSIDSETEYKDGNSKGTSSGVSSLDVSHEQQ